MNISCVEITPPNFPPTNGQLPLVFPVDDIENNNSVGALRRLSDSS